VVLAIGMGCAASTPTGDTAPTATPFPTAPAAARRTVMVERGTVQQLLVFTGRWLPRDQFRLAFPIDGAIRNINVQRNSTVTIGTLLADYQIADLENTLAEQEIQLESAQFRLQSEQTGSNDPVIDAQFALANANLQLEIDQQSIDWTRVANARVALDAAQRKLDEAQRSYDDVVSRANSTGSQIDAAYNALQDARTALQTAQNNYFSASQDYNTAYSRLRLQENNVLQNELNLQDVQGGGTGASFEAVQAVRLAENAVNQTRASITQSSLFSPIDGVILSVEVNPGDSVQAFVPVIIAAVPEPLEVVATGLPFNDVQRLSVGDIGICTITNPQLAVQCVVRDLPLSASDTDQSVRVAAMLPEAASGQSVEVQMPLETREDVLWLPPGFVRTFQQRTFVIILTDGGEQVRDVVVGLRTTEREEIISGFNVGEVVVAP
jgi:multidrug resistance efflux pump